MEVEAPSVFGKPYEYLLVLDFEAACNENHLPKPKPQGLISTLLSALNIPKLTPSEIIEFPTLLYNVKTGNIDSTFHHYIKPQACPKLSAFCTQLTGITQTMVDTPPLGGKSFVEVFKLHRQWLLDCGLINEQNEQIVPFAYLTCGDWDLKTALPINCSHFKVSIPQYMKSWINIKTYYSKYMNANARGMAAMLDGLKLKLEGKHHSGIADCHNILQIVITLQQKFQIVWKDPSFENDFKEGDWNCPKCNDHNFASRTSCRQCGEARSGDSNNKPQQQNSNNAMRPGDWACSKCNDVNFARRDTCRKCSTPKNSNNNGNNNNNNNRNNNNGNYTYVPKIGDWSCKCGFSNFARNTVCKNCNSPK